jgi:hypothetical protein
MQLIWSGDASKTIHLKKPDKNCANLQKATGKPFALLGTVSDLKFCELGPNMASTTTSSNLAIDSTADGALVAAEFTAHESAYCGSSIVSGER